MSVLSQKLKKYHEKTFNLNYFLKNNPLEEDTVYVSPRNTRKLYTYISLSFMDSGMC